MNGIFEINGISEGKNQIAKFAKLPNSFERITGGILGGITRNGEGEFFT